MLLPWNAATTLKMDQPTEAQSWVQKPQHRQRGFEEPRPGLLKILIDLRPKGHQPTFQAPPARGSGPSLSSLLSHHQQSKASDSVVQSLSRSCLLILSKYDRVLGRTTKHAADAYESTVSEQAKIALRRYYEDVYHARIGGEELPKLKARWEKEVIARERVKMEKEIGDRYRRQFQPTMESLR